MIEAELKCRLTTEMQPELQKKLQGMTFRKAVHNLDIYYDTPSWDLLQRAVFVRIRNHEMLEFKFNAQVEQEHVHCAEHAFPLKQEKEIADGMNMLFTHFLPEWRAVAEIEAALAKNHLVELARIDNQRTIYTDGDVEVSIDHVARLGDFLEIETRYKEGEEDDATGALAKIQALAHDLNAEHIKVGYVELWLQMDNPQAYRLGKYQLE